MPPHEVLERFTEGEMVNLIAYENLYGQLGPERLDTLVARLGMDVVAPHLKRGQKPKFEDHLITWGAGKKKQKMSPQEMLAEAKAISKAYKAGHKPTRKKSTQQQGDQKPPGSKTTSGPSAIQRRRRRS